MASILTFLLVSLALALVFGFSVMMVLRDYLVYRDLRRRLREEEKRQEMTNHKVKEA